MLHPISSMLAQMILAFYYDAKESLAHQAFKLEQKFPGILGATSFRPLYDRFPFALWGMMESAVSRLVSETLMNVESGNRCFRSSDICTSC